MLGILRLAAGSLFLILTVLFFTAAAQQTNDTPAKDLKGESAFTESAQTRTEKESFIKKDTNFFTPAENRFTSLKPAETGEDEPQATTERSIYKHRRGAIEYNFEVGIAPLDPTHFTGEKVYNTTGRKLGTLNFRVGRVLGTAKGVTVTYLFGFTPLVVARANEVRNPAYVSPIVTPNVLPTMRETSYGIGATPANFRFTFLPDKRFKLFVQTGAGVLFFSKPLPIPESRRLQLPATRAADF